MDETGHTFRARLGTTWAPVGQVRVLKRLSKRREVSSIVLLTAPQGRERPRVLARHFVGAVHDKDVIAALRYFRRRIGHPLVIIWDRLQAHRSKAVTAWLQRHAKDFRIEWLPPYAPDLNPEEGCNGMVKEALLNAAPHPSRTSSAWHEGNSALSSIAPMSSAPSSRMLGSMFSGLDEAV